MFKYFVIILLLISCITFYSCKNNTEIKAKLVDTASVSTIVSGAKVQSTTLEEDKDFIAKYVCPNHCNGSGSEKQGTCSICGMELIENIDY